MRKVFGWLLLLAAMGIIRLIVFNTVRYDDVNWLIGGLWIAVCLLCLFGWYKLIFNKSSKVKHETSK